MERIEVSLTWDDLNFSEASFIVGKNQMKAFVEVVGNKVDDAGFIVSKDGEKIKAQSEDEIKLTQLGSLSSGSKNFIKKNIASYSEFLSEKRTQ